MFSKKSAMPYIIMAAIAALISVFDNVMNVVFMETLESEEKNPVASWIISHYGVYGLVKFKAIGTVVAAIIMFLLAKTKYRVVIIPVFAFQVALFLYLSLAIASPGFWSKDMFRPVTEFFRFYWEKI